jgi:tRNA(Ile)-lysidine synthase
MEYLENLISVNSVQDMLAHSQDCVIAVSGGADSMMLLHWFSEHRDKFTQQFRVVHVNHNIQAVSAEWADFVAQTCVQYHMPCEIINVSLDGYGNNLENAARKARYHALCNVGADTVIFAHHGSDQVENFFLRVFRGSGVRGLKSMTPVTPCWYDHNIQLVRPLLEVTRGQILDYNKHHTVCFIQDPSNADNNFDRNFIRNKMWPVVEQRFDIADVNTLRTIQHLGEAWQLLSDLADIDIDTVTLPDGSMSWRCMQQIGYMRIKNLILRLLDIHGVYGFRINTVEQFVQGILAATIHSKNEFSLKGFRIYKQGQLVHVSVSTPTKVAA